MRRNQNDSPLLWLLPVPVVLWLAALLATEYKAEMTVFTLMGRFSWLMEHPFSVRWTPHTPKFILWALAAYGFAVALYLSTRENRRPGEEHGSAKWGSAKRLNAKYRDKDPRNNTILTQNVRMSLNGKMHRRNLLQIVIGGSGAGKTRFFVKPNLMEANCSFLVTDPKGETLRAVAPLLLQKGYVIKVFDLIDPSHSDSFNAFAYIKDDKDVMKLVNNFIKNTTPKGAQQNDPFWERSEIALDTALILYLIHEAPPEEQNFEMLIYMIENGGAKEDDDDYQSPLDLLFEALEEDDPSHIAVREYKIYKQAAGAALHKLLTELRPDAVLCVGQYGGANCIRVERVAINLRDARIADNAGKQPTDEPVVAGGPDAYFATIPTREIVDALRERGIPAQLSYSAGTFVCNNLLYCALHESERSNPAPRCGFVHVPYLPEQTKDGNAPSMGLEMMVKALHIAVEAIAEEEKQ